MSEDQAIIFIPIIAFVVLFLIHRFHRMLYRNSLKKENPFSYYRKFVFGDGHGSPFVGYIVLTLPFWMYTFDPKNFPQIATFEYENVGLLMWFWTMTFVGYMCMLSFTYYFMKAEKECPLEERSEPFYKLRVYLGLGIWFLALPIFAVVRWMNG